MNPLRSDSTCNLMKAFATFQGLLENVKKEANNPFFKSKYADLASIFEEVRPKLAACGLAISQWPEADGSLVTLLMHESGEWMQGSYVMQPTDNKPQSIGSAITYARRYALSAILGIASEDDDGNAAQGKSQGNSDRPLRVAREGTEKPAAAREAPPPHRMTSADVTTPEQRNLLRSDVKRVIGTEKGATEWIQKQMAALDINDWRKLTTGELAHFYETLAALDYELNPQGTPPADERQEGDIKF